MKISNNYLVVEKVEEEAKEGFQTVDVQDSFIYKGRVTQVSAVPVYMGDNHVSVGDVILFAKYSPDTHEMDWEGKKVKFVAVSDVLAVL